MSSNDMRKLVALMAVLWLCVLGLLVAENTIGI